MLQQRLTWMPTALAAICVWLIQVQPADTQRVYQDGAGHITFALSGDSIISRKVSVHDEPAFLKLREIIGGATVGFTNLEMLFHNYEEDIIPASQSGGTYMSAHPDLAKELVWMGFDLVSRANNHTMDYGLGGLRATTRAVEAAGLVQAGAGENLAEARAPAYLETPGGRVALISVSSSFADHMRAGHQRQDLRGRPGLSPLRYDTTYLVPPAQLEALRGIRRDLRLGGRDDGDRLTMFGATFVAGDRHEVRTSPHAGDLADVVAAVRDARQLADWVVVTSHTHEADGHREVPAQFLVTFARAVIDAGADIVTGHGPHILRGIEIYRGKPIFYSLADFIFQNDTVTRQPADNYERYGLPAGALPSDFYSGREAASGGGWPADATYWDSALAVVRFRAGSLEEVRLHPLTLGFGLDRPQRGRPMVADDAEGRRIIETLQRLSQPYNTSIEYIEGVGVIRGTPGTAREDQ
ncbi:MAG: CapA family protein [Vicinamibacterales bacterium]|nr:CapA family protein [Vicinamibacterales bacterium]